MGVARDGAGWRTKDRVAEAVEALATRGWQVTYVAQHSAPQPFLRHRIAPGVRVLAMPARLRTGADLRQLVAGLRAVSAAPVVLVFMPRIRTALALIALGHRAVMYAGSAWAQTHTAQRWRARLEAVAARRAGAVIVAGDALYDHFAPRARAIARAVPMVPPEVAERLRARAEVLPRGERDLRVLFVGSIGRRKGIEALLEALDGPAGITVRIVGHHDETDAIEGVRALAAQGALEHRDYLEWDELRDAYAWADVLCLPSYAEGFPRVAYEAAAFGTALLLTPVGGIPSRLRHDHDALFVTPEAPRSYATRWGSSPLTGRSRRGSPPRPSAR